MNEGISTSAVPQPPSTGISRPASRPLLPKVASEAAVYVKRRGNSSDVVYKAKLALAKSPSKVESGEDPKASSLKRSRSLPKGSFGRMKTQQVLQFPENETRCGAVRAVPFRLQTSAGFESLMESLAHHERSAVILDFDNVIRTTGGCKRGAMQGNVVRGGDNTASLLWKLHMCQIPLFIVTARRSEKLPELLQLLDGPLGLSGCFKSPHKHDSESPRPICIDKFRNGDLDLDYYQVRGTSIFSAGYSKEKLVAHIATCCLPPNIEKLVFVDDNVFNAYFVLRETPQLIHTQQPGRTLNILASWWDPSEEQSRGRIEISFGSDFSFHRDFQPCLLVFGVDEKERIRTAGILAAKAMLSGRIFHVV